MVPQSAESQSPTDKFWTLQILTPEESERLLREEPRISEEEFLKDLEEIRSEAQRAQLSEANRDG